MGPLAAAAVVTGRGPYGAIEEVLLAVVAACCVCWCCWACGECGFGGCLGSALRFKCGRPTPASWLVV